MNVFHKLNFAWSLSILIETLSGYKNVILIANGVYILHVYAIVINSTFYRVMMDIESKFIFLLICKKKKTNK